MQRVGFCYQAQKEAIGLGLTGWVRNNSGGSVDILAEWIDPPLAKGWVTKI